jgi:hypothetical protein
MKANKSIPFFLVPLALLLLCQCDTARNTESPAKRYFLKYIGNEGDQTGVDFEVNPDGTFILLGTTKKKETGTTQLYVVKADAQGNVIWEKFFGGPLDEQARDVEITSDGRIVILGNSVTAPGNRDILLMTLSPDGIKIDSVLQGFKNAVTKKDTDEDATSVTQTNDGFIVAGSSDNLVHPSDTLVNFFKRDGLIWRVNDNLTKYSASWTDPPAFGQGSESVTTKIFQLPNNDFYAFGYAKWSQSNGSSQTDFDFWYFSLGNAGGIPNNGVGSFGSRNTDEKLRSVAFIPLSLGGGYFLGGVVTDKGGNDDVYFTRLRSQLAFDTSDPNFAPASLGYNLGQLKNELVSATLSRTSGYFLLSNEVSRGNSNLFLMKIGTDGKKGPWSSPVIYGGEGDDFIGAVRELADGKIAVFGTMSIGQPNGETKMVLIKVNKDGQFAD